MLTPTGILKDLHVLVVDDYPEMTSLVGEIMVDEGASIVSANSGTAAISFILSGRFDLLILDLGMPQPDGLKIIEFLRATNLGLLRHTLVLTGRKYDRAAVAILKKLSIPCMFKPFQIEDLVEAMARLAMPGSARVRAV
jgi:DNA-binding response OmpR family regulator